LKPLPNTE